jgi:hypothetical protein
VHSISPRKDETAFMTFLEQLLQAIPADEALVVVLDNAGYHKSLALREWWRAHAAQLQPFFLPAYTPQLNLINSISLSGCGAIAKASWLAIAGGMTSSASNRRPRPSSLGSKSISMPPMDRRSDHPTTFAKPLSASFLKCDRHILS